MNIETSEVEKKQSSSKNKKEDIEPRTFRQRKCKEDISTYNVNVQESTNQTPIDVNVKVTSKRKRKRSNSHQKGNIEMIQDMPNSKEKDMFQEMSKEKKERKITSTDLGEEINEQVQTNYPEA